MTVAELIAHLSQLDPNLPVLVDGYEFGYDTAQTPVKVRVQRVANKSYAGTFQDAKSDSQVDVIDAALIGRV